MLIITRKRGETVRLYQRGRMIAEIKITSIEPDRVGIGFEADKDIDILRDDARVKFLGGNHERNSRV